MLGVRGRHSTKEDGHCPGAHLIIRNLAGGKPGYEIIDFLSGQFLTFPFFFDKSGDVHWGFYSYFDALAAQVSCAPSRGSDGAME
jgi:hypothetical protein